MDYMKEQVDNFKHVPGQIRGDFSVYDSDHTLLYSSKNYKPGSSERVAGKRKMIVKAGGTKRFI